LGFGVGPPTPKPQSPIPNPQSPIPLIFLIKLNIIQFLIKNILDNL